MPSALVTGASRGLGYELCVQLSALGWKVAALSRSEGGDLTRLASSLEGQLKWFKCDVGSLSAGSVVSDALKFLGSLDLLVNNAGIPGWSSGLDATDPNEVESLFNTHVLGSLRVARAAAPALIAAEAAHIVNISSRLASISRTASGEFTGRGFSYSYRIAKAALNMLGACMAEELGPKGVRVSVIHPGSFKSAAAASGASMSAREAAQRLCRWLPTRDNSPLVFIEPEVGVLPW